MFYRRRLPHLHVIERAIFITWRLHGSLPANRAFPTETSAGKAFVEIDAILDRAVSGNRYLMLPEIARLTVDAFRYGAENLRQYELHAFVVMANHVHLLVTPHVAVVKITQGLKRFTAQASNRILGRAGQAFWQDESYDHLVRDQQEFARIARYIEMNPVRAGVACSLEAFPFSSATGHKPNPDRSPAWVASGRDFPSPA